ncbi:hypothetical protein [Pseudoduganella sp. GCM10020061]|uniref:hypothetical protein n=1 Tax=Pseudoduganella sp. GCM10020061 TaxID=3317345 RepID=UPI00363ECE29
MYTRTKSDAPGAFLLLGSAMAALLSCFWPGAGWLAAVAALVMASLLILRIGILPFLTVCSVTLAHFLVLGPPLPYGRGSLPFDYLLMFVLAPLTVAAGAIAVWYWRSPSRS